MKWTKRELQEIYHALFYEETTKHGTVGHNQLLIIAKLAKADGFRLERDEHYAMYCNKNFLGCGDYWPDEEIEL